jgi:glutamate synthase (NADPH/NADH) small chain
VADPPAWLTTHGVVLDDAGRIVVDARGRTAQAKIYAGGDNTRGPNLVVTAMAAGRLAAEDMLERFSFSGRLMEKAEKTWHLLPHPARKSVSQATHQAA